MPKDHPFRTPKKRQQSIAIHKRKTKPVRHSSFWTNTILEEGCGTSEGGKNCGNVYYSGSLAPTPPRSAINHRGRDNGRSKPGFYQVKLSRRGGSGSVCLFISFSCIHFFSVFFNCLTLFRLFIIFWLELLRLFSVSSFSSFPSYSPSRHSLIILLRRFFDSSLFFHRPFLFFSFYFPPLPLHTTVLLPFSPYPPPLSPTTAHDLIPASPSEHRRGWWVPWPTFSTWSRRYAREVLPE